MINPDDIIIEEFNKNQFVELLGWLRLEKQEIVSHVEISFSNLDVVEHRKEKIKAEIMHYIYKDIVDLVRELASNLGPGKEVLKTKANKFITEYKIGDQ